MSSNGGGNSFCQRRSRCDDCDPNSSHLGLVQHTEGGFIIDVEESEIDRPRRPRRPALLYRSSDLIRTTLGGFWEFRTIPMTQMSHDESHGHPLRCADRKSPQFHLYLWIHPTCTNNFDTVMADTATLCRERCIEPFLPDWVNPNIDLIRNRPLPKNSPRSGGNTRLRYHQVGSFGQEIV